MKARKGDAIMSKVKVSKKIKMALAYVQKQINGCDEMISRAYARREGANGVEFSFSYWADSNAELVCRNESAKRYWESVLKTISTFATDLACAENDIACLQALIEQRQNWITKAMRFSGHNSTNEMSNLIASWDDQALKLVIGDCFSSGESLVNLIYQWEHFDDKE